MFYLYTKSKIRQTNKLFLIVFYLIFQFVSGLFGQNSTSELYFKNDTAFKIVQITDIHWVSDQSGNESNLAMIRDILDVEKPDLVVFTGDIVLSEQESMDELKVGWKEVTKPVIDRKIPWVAVLGNHDSEGTVSRKDVYKCFEGLKYNLNTGDTNGLHDFYLPVLTKDKKIGSVIYLFDSNDYPDTFMPGHYAWITSDQIDKYKVTSDSLKTINGGRAIPAVAFFHIPIPEYKQVLEDKEHLVGHVGEAVESPEINTGLFSAMVLQGDVMGTFCGHDHNNDFIGELQHIALAFGRCSGHNAYGDYRNGVRVIELYPNQFSFDTWIRIPSREEFRYHFPAGSPVIKNYLPAISSLNKPEHGVNYTYYEGQANSVADIKELTQITNGTSNTFDISKANAEDHFAYVFDTYIQIPDKDVYTFYLRSDDGSKLIIDDKMIVDNDGGHSAKTEKGSVGLEKGFHHVKLLYFEDYMGQELEVGIESNSIKKSVIDPKMLFIEK